MEQKYSFIENGKVSDQVSRCLHRYIDDAIYYLNELHADTNISEEMKNDARSRIESSIINISFTLLGKNIHFYNF